MKRERLFSRIPAPGIGKLGISTADIDRVVLVPDLIDDILECLRSEDKVDATFGLFFLEQLHNRGEFKKLAQRSLSVITPLIETLLEHQDLQVRSAAARTFVVFRENYSNYRHRMLLSLKSADAEIRRVALWAAPTFLTTEEVDVLGAFQKDPEFGETGGIGGPLRYDLRDYALETAERISGKTFDSGDCFDSHDGQRISWRSWSAFNNWVERKKGRNWF